MMARALYVCLGLRNIDLAWGRSSIGTSVDVLRAACGCQPARRATITSPLGGGQNCMRGRVSKLSYAVQRSARGRTRPDQGPINRRCGPLGYYARRGVRVWRWERAGGRGGKDSRSKVPAPAPAPDSLSPIIVNCGASMFVAWPAQGSTHKVASAADGPTAVRRPDVCYWR
jgi:hypothetical protein